MPQLFQTEFEFQFPWPAQVYAVINKYPNPLAPHVVSMDVLDRSILPDGTVRSERLIGIQQDTPKWLNRLVGAQDTTFVREISFTIPSATPNPDLPAEKSLPLSHLEPPKLLMASTNLTLAHLMQCRESISYIPQPWPRLPEPTAENLAPSRSHDSDLTPLPPPAPPAHPFSHPTLPPNTLFSQSALIFSTGIFAAQAYPPHGISPNSPIRPLSYPMAGTFPLRAAGRKVEQFSLTRFETNAESGRGAMLWALKEKWQEANQAENLT